MLRKKWQRHLLTMLRQTLRTEAVNRLVDACFQKYPDGLVPNVHKGAVPAQAHSVARYVAKYGYFCPTPASVKSAARGGTSWTEMPYTWKEALSG